MKQLKIVKIGGNIIDEPEKLKAVLNAFARLNEPKILVHGGGKKATEISNQLGIESRMVNGRRITDEQTLNVAIMVYAGLLNKNIVAVLQSLGENAIGLSGSDGNAITAIKRPVTEIDFGFAGDIVRVNDELVKKLLDLKLIPVFCAITHDGRGQLLNTNADTVATELAIAMSKFFNVQLIFCFEKAGVLADVNDDRSVVEKLTLKEYAQLRQNRSVTDGMIPKLDNAFQSLRKGVQSVHIVNHLNLRNVENNIKSAGTVITLE
ncbi:MAG: acetylglutamate kinase [Calditrichaeota bacterium]|nr:acetylglutamate kinase [Calditrichota bacterium]